MSNLSQVSSSQTLAAAETEESTSNTPIAPPSDMATPQGDSCNVSLSLTEAANVELDLNELPSPNQQEWLLVDVLVETLAEALQDHATAADNTNNE